MITKRIFVLKKYINIENNSEMFVVKRKTNI